MSQNYLLFLIILFIVYSNTDAQNQSSVVRNVVMTSKFPNERFVATFEPPATPGGEIKQYRIYLIRRFSAPVCDATFIMKCSDCADTTVGSAGGTLPTNCSNFVDGSFSKTDTTIRITSGDPNIPSATVYYVTFEAGNAWGWGAPFYDKLTSGHYTPPTTTITPGEIAAIAMCLLVLILLIIYICFFCVCKKRSNNILEKIKERLKKIKERLKKIKEREEILKQKENILKIYNIFISNNIFLCCVLEGLNVDEEGFNVDEKGLNDDVEGLIGEVKEYHKFKILLCCTCNNIRNEIVTLFQEIEPR